MSERDPKPCEDDPARNERVPFRFGVSFAFATTTGDPSGIIRSTGRFAVDRNTQSQSPLSVWLLRGANCTASNNVVRVRLSRMPAPALTLIFSRRVGRKAGAETLML